MAHFIELTQIACTWDGELSRKILVAVEHIDFYYDRRIVFTKRAIDVSESYEEIKKKIDEAMEE